ncbi:thioredoxin [Paenibacillus dakarensis]|uniref:thioredoxin n=1 Tax=Paenibacillus dakarensis TaxID=1527293 RepID=UPI0006D52CAD|nr:thioredoxin [Paenibacillus dakarensis]
MTTMKVTDSSMEQVVKNNKLVLVDFWAPWCGPCRMIAPILDKLSEKVGNKAIIAKLNVDENPVSATKYRIQGIPTLKLFHNGVVVETFVGVQPSERFEAAINKYAGN